MDLDLAHEKNQNDYYSMRIFDISQYAVSYSIVLAHTCYLHKTMSRGCQGSSTNRPRVRGDSGCHSRSPPGLIFQGHV